ncbi:MAG TPA: LCP family protein [Actinomycetes bacterium]|jgi:LCP family protein required for cell wall assembly|nr:LCP family protein [Actinomycetes bacterium]
MVDTTSRALRRHAMSERIRRKRRRLFASVSLALALVTVLGSAGYARWRFGQIASVEVPGLHSANAGQPFNVLVVGSDSRAGANRRYGNVAGQRNDVTMVVRVDPGKRRVSLVSIPRDLLIPIAEGGGTDKINAAFTGGPSRVAKTIEQNFGIPIHHYVLIDFNGFKNIVDALGGIRIYFPYPSRDMDDHGRNMSGLNIPRAGCQRLSGSQALALARSRDFSYLRDGVRRWDRNGDLGRIRRQQAFLQGVLRKALATGLTNPIRANGFIGAIVHDLTKDKGLDIGEVVRLGARFRSFKPSDLEAFTMPTQPLMQGETYRGEVLKLPAAQRVVARFLGVPDPTATQAGRPSTGPSKATAPTQVHIRNAIGVQGIAARTSDQLRRAGFRIADVGNASITGLTVTRIAYPPGEAAKARALRAAVVGTVELREDPGLPAGEMTLLIGSNFRGVQAAAPATSVSTATTRSTQPSGARTPAGAGKPELQLQDFDPRPC